ncbi:MAG: peptidoglycan-binding protein LysM, partial [Altibacter sp.]|nr:peptidoglycan-binding protein LysM [Altibacter sp.]
SGFSFRKESKSSSIFTSEIEGELAYVPFAYEVDMNPQQNIPFVGKSYLGFCEDLGFSESSGNYNAVNRLGYMGKYQFGRSALNWVGIYNKSQFLNSPLLQEKAFEALISKNKWVLKDYITKFNGQVIDGIRITESGLIAAAHLGGAGNVMKFLESNGEDVFADANNVPITRYMKEFAHYDLTSILPDNNAKATL